MSAGRRTHLAHVVGAAVGGIWLQTALAVALHAGLRVHVGRGRLGGRAARAAGVLGPVAHLHMSRSTINCGSVTGITSLPYLAAFSMTN